MQRGSTIVSLSSLASKQSATSNEESHPSADRPPATPRHMMPMMMKTDIKPLDEITIIPPRAPTEPNVKRLRVGVGDEDKSVLGSGSATDKEVMQVYKVVYDTIQRRKAEREKLNLVSLADCRQLDQVYPCTVAIPSTSSNQTVHITTGGLFLSHLLSHHHLWPADLES